MSAPAKATGRGWRFPAGVTLPAIVFVSLLLVLFPRDQILTFAARTEVAAFTTRDDATTRFWIASGAWAAGPTDAECGAIKDQLLAIASGAAVTIRTVGKTAVITISHATSGGTIGQAPLGERAWIRVCGPQDENLIIPFVGAFSIGEPVGPTTATVLLDGRAEVVEGVLFGSLTYVNRTVELIRGDRLDVEPGQTARGFVYFSWNTDQETGMFVRAQADPGTAHLFRTPERAPLTLRGSLWGRLRDGADVGYVLLALSGLSALVQVLLFFRESEDRDKHEPRPAPAAKAIASPPEPLRPSEPSSEPSAPHAAGDAAEPGTPA